MKKLLLFVSVIALGFAGCGKKDTGCMPVSPQSEEASILKYATDSSITVVKHPSGIYYQVINPGTGAKPTINSTVSASYTGRLLNGSKFDESLTPIDFPLSGVIEGWGIAIPLIAKGGRIKMIIPSSYAYGCIGAGGRIPSNAVLYFDVTLANIK